MICLLRQMYACTFVYLGLRIQVLAVDLHLQCRARARGQNRKWDSVQLPLIGSTSLARKDQVLSTRPLTTSLGFFSSSSFLPSFTSPPLHLLSVLPLRAAQWRALKSQKNFFFFSLPVTLTKPGVLMKVCERRNDHWSLIPHLCACRSGNSTRTSRFMLSPSVALSLALYLSLSLSCV